MVAQRDTATLSDMEFLNAYVDHTALHPESTREYNAEEQKIMNLTRRRIMEAMMMWQSFGGAVPKAVTPIITGILGLMASPNAVGSICGTAVGSGIALLGPCCTKMMLRCYAEQNPNITLDCFAEGWRNLSTGQGDSFEVRKARMEATLNAVPNGLRRWLGLAFIWMNRTDALRKVFTNVYIECLTASPALQKRVSAGKRLLLRKEARALQEKEAKLNGLTTAVAGQDQMVRQLSADHAYHELETNDAKQRVTNLELEVLALRKQQEQLLALTQTQQADMLRLQESIIKAVAAAQEGRPMELTVLTLRTAANTNDAHPQRIKA